MARIVLLTGLAGAGRTTASDILEDMGYYVMENLPAAIINDVVAQMHNREDDDARFAVAVDVRDEKSIAQLFAVRHDLRELGDIVEVVFLDADDDTIIRRFEQTRRPHPYISAGVLTKGIEIERDLMSDVLANSDVHIDTTVTNPTELGVQLQALFSNERTGTTLVVNSFGYKYGAPRDADFMIDVRFLPNPFWEPELRDHTGLENEVQEYVRQYPDYQKYITSLQTTLSISIKEFATIGKGFVNIAFGCTGGVHRSVTVAQDIATYFRTQEYKVILVHRELDHEEM